MADKAPADRLNEIIWASVRGVGSFQPKTPRWPAALRGMGEGDEQDDDD